MLHLHSETLYHALPQFTRAQCQAVEIAALLAGDSDEAEIAHRGSGSSTVTLDHHHLETLAGGKIGMGKPDDAATDNGQIVLAGQLFARSHDAGQPDQNFARRFSIVVLGAPRI